MHFKYLCGLIFKYLSMKNYTHKKKNAKQSNKLELDSFFSKGVEKMRASDIRDALKLVEGKRIISFAGGLPDPETFPREEIRDIINMLEYSDFSSSFQYGATLGMIGLRKELANFVSKRGIINVDEDNILVSAGSQEAIYILCFLLLNPGDDIIVEAPTYVAALNAMRLKNPVLHGIPLKNNGMDIEELERELKEIEAKGRKIKFIYTIPSSQNPSGITMSMENRKKLLKIAEEHNILIIEDDAYGFLGFDGDTPDAIKSLDTNGRVIYTSTFSKILAPGFRLGWVVANPEIILKMELLKQSIDLHSSTFTQRIALETLRRGVIERNIPKVRKLYKEKRDVMVKSIRRWFPKDVKYRVPNGGMFIFVWLDSRIDTRELLPEAVKRGVAFVPGAGFYHDDSGKNTMRLNFSQPSIREIEEGIKVLGTLIKDKAV